MPAPLLELAGITHRFGDVLALDGAALQLRAGSVHALLGENGAGKTTLMRVAFGAVTPDAGTVHIDGEAAPLRTPADAIARGVGMVHQHFTTIPAMSVAENVALGGRGRLRLAEVVRRIEALSAASGLRLDVHARLDTMSVASLQRLEILKALSRDARILIFDEPTAVLAPGEASELMAWIRAWATGTRAAVLITHKLHEALSIADDVTVLRGGRTVATSPAPAASVADVARAMLGAPRDAADVDRPVPGAREPNVANVAPTTVIARLDRVSAAFEGERVQQASLVVRAGEIVGIAGVEGAGQRVLLRALAGRVAPTGGHRAVAGAAGFIPEDRLRDALVAEASVVANVALKGAGARRGSMDWRHWTVRAGALVRRHDVRGVLPGRERTTRAASLSGGNQQKLVVARELGDAPQLVVAEHPTRGLDVRSTAAVTERLRRAAADGAAVVFHSADLDELLALAHRVVVVHAGTVRECARDRDTVGRAMLGLD